MNALATIVACYGLLADSTAVVIGAMVLAMLLGPITGIGLGLVDGDSQLLWQAVIAFNPRVNHCVITLDGLPGGLLTAPPQPLHHIPAAAGVKAEVLGGLPDALGLPQGWPDLFPNTGRWPPRREPGRLVQRVLAFLAISR